MPDILNTLKFWHKIEYFSVYELKDFFIDNIKRLKADEGSVFPWELMSAEKSREFIVYFGVFDLEKLVTEIEKHYGKEKRCEELDIQSCICTFKIKIDNGNLEIQIGTLKVSGLPFGVERVLHDRINPDTWSTDFFNYKNKIMDNLFNIYNEINIENLLHLKNEIIDMLDFPIPFYDKWFFIDEIMKEDRKKEEESEDKEDQSAINLSNIGFEDENVYEDDFYYIKEKLYKSKEILNSFYASDLEKIIEETEKKNYGQAFKNYFKKSYKRINIENDIEAIKENIHPINLPLGSWPSNHSLSLMQQIAVNISKSPYVEKEKIFSVNGPPGTGKTTLLRDIIASIVVDRALELLGYINPDDVFLCKTKLNIGPSEQGFNLYILNDTFRKYGIIVASNNNKAVENITKELPGMGAVPEEFIDDKYSYFKKESSYIYGEESWALITAAMGNRKNCEKFIKKFWNIDKDIEADSMREALYEKDYRSDWKEARQSFSSKLAEVKLEISKLTNCKDVSLLESILKENTPDEKYYKDFENSEEAQKNCPWAYEKLNRLRQELFIEALMLHRSFVLNSKGMKNNLNLFFQMQTNKLNPEIVEKHKNDIFQSFFMLIPAISTTFASVERFLGGIGKEEIGYLIIDEAGQVVPQAAVGAIWRSRKVIAVGDPLQIEPIVNIPQKIINRFGDIYNIEKKYLRRERSLQNQADNANTFGAKRLDDTIWVGSPLKVHRRCQEPMFQISNNIAYNRKMILAVKKESSLSTRESKWIDIKGKTQTPHFILEQGLYIYNLMFDQFKSLEEDMFPDIYVITPFTTVKTGLLEMFLENRRFYEDIKYKRPDIKKRQLTKFFLNNIGTVHTFQGKEADKVILCLGGDINNKGLGAARWAASKPNILNVAVTRAKKSLIIIGDKDLWSNLPYFKTAFKYL